MKQEKAFLFQTSFGWALIIGDEFTPFERLDLAVLALEKHNKQHKKMTAIEQYIAGREAHVAAGQKMANAANLENTHPVDTVAIHRLREDARALRIKAANLGYSPEVKDEL